MLSELFDTTMGSQMIQTDAFLVAVVGLTTRCLGKSTTGLPGWCIAPCAAGVISPQQRRWERTTPRVPYTHRSIGERT